MTDTPRNSPDDRYTLLRAEHLDVVPILTNSIAFNSSQPRKSKYDPHWKEFVANIKQFGVLEPILVTDRNQGFFELVAGERRLRAAIEAGLVEVLGRILDHDKVDIEAIALIENIQRQDLNPIDKACAVAKLVKKNNGDKKAVGKLLGLDRTSITNLVKVSTLLPEIIDELRENDSYALRELIKIASIDDNEKQLEAFRAYQLKIGIKHQTDKPGEAIKKGGRRQYTEVFGSQIKAFGERLVKLPGRDKEDIEQIIPELIKLKRQITKVLTSLEGNQ